MTTAICVECQTAVPITTIMQWIDEDKNQGICADCYDPGQIYFDFKKGEPL